MSTKVISPTYFKVVESVPTIVFLSRIHHGCILTLVPFWSHFPHFLPESQTLHLLRGRQSRGPRLQLDPLQATLVEPCTVPAVWVPSRVTPGRGLGWLSIAPSFPSLSGNGLEGQAHALHVCESPIASPAVPSAGKLPFHYSTERGLDLSSSNTAACK